MNITFANGHEFEPVPNEGGSLYMVEASTIGLEPGDWPAVIPVTLAARGLEPEMTEEFYRQYIRHDREGEIVEVIYQTRLGGTTLTVWND